MTIEGTVDSLVGAFIFAIALSFIPASIISFTVKERIDHIKH